eukprot:GGOE01019559.1.p1 GENE.GGOE01019559.1~~GGOE01019559.1.p1  ORF type:complete len:560 (-),score=149.05 GGOE01019559.1:23-1702(-)
MTVPVEEVQDDFVVIDKSLYFHPMQAVITETPPPGYVVSYAIRVSHGEPHHRWVVDRRFSDFQNLVGALQAVRKGQRKFIPRLPGTHVFKATNRDSALLEERRAGLNRFLDELLQSDLAESSPVLAFLEVPPTCPQPELSDAALREMHSGFRWTCMAHVLHFRRVQSAERANGCCVDPPHRPDSEPVPGTTSCEGSPLFSPEAEDFGVKMPITTLTSQSWACTSFVPAALGDCSFSDDSQLQQDSDGESPEWHELAALHWHGLTQFNPNQSLRCGATRFKAHFKKDGRHVRVAMNPVALYMDARPCPQAFLGSGVLYSADDVQVRRGLVFYDAKHLGAVAPDDRSNFLVTALFRRDGDRDHRKFSQVANHLRCKAQDARTLLKVIQVCDPPRAQELMAAALEEHPLEEGRGHDVGSWVDLKVHRPSIDERRKTCPVDGEEKMDAVASPVRTVELPAEPTCDPHPVHLRVVDRDLSILLSFTVYYLLLRRYAGACEILLLGSNEFVALRSSKFALHTWDVFREQDEWETERREEDSPRSVIPSSPGPAGLGDLRLPEFEF